MEADKEAEFSAWYVKEYLGDIEPRMAYNEASDRIEKEYGGQVFSDDPEWVQGMIQGLMRGDIKLDE